MDANKAKYWVATFGNVVRYIRERNEEKTVYIQFDAVPNAGTIVIIKQTTAPDEMMD